MTNLSGKTALVTGASRGIGRASALALAAAGAQVLVHYGRGATEADGVVAEIRKAAAAVTRSRPIWRRLTDRISLRNSPAISSVIASISLSPMRESRKPQRSRRPPLRISIGCSPSTFAPPSFSSSNCFRFCRRVAASFSFVARGAWRCRDDPGLRSNQRRHRHAGEAFRLVARCPRHPRQRRRARCRRDGHVGLHQDRRRPRLCARHAGIQASGAT